jgi:16S rRNA (adenine1518-N6/adenine1519-N6)-dimethyltransferase
MSKHIRPKKWLGQHFLADTSVSIKIAALLPANGQGAALVEVGPGEGALTKHLPTEGYRGLYLLDVDGEAVDVLNTRFVAPPYHVRLADFLEADFASFGAGPVVIAGNFPYNISSQIFFKVLDEIANVDTVVCMVQREVARRIASKPGNKEYGILSVLLQLWFDIRYAFTVKPGAFIPPPKVDSGVIVLARNKRQLADIGVPPAYFTQVVKAAFGQRRKMLRNALTSVVPILPDDLPYLNQRAEQLSVADFIILAKKLYEGTHLDTTNLVLPTENPIPEGQI